ncbi:MAG: glycosyltransferase family 2 protein [bacterium]
MKVCVVIPAYNEVDAIGNVIRKAKGFVQDVVVIDDGSEDDTYIAAKEAGAVILRHNRNMGKGAALKTGFGYALAHGYDAVITMDADGQHNCRDIPKLLERAEDDDVDIVIGSRMIGDTRIMPFIRWLTNKVTSALVSKTANQRVTDSQSGFRLIKRHVLQQVELESGHYDTESEILIKSGKKGFKVAEVLTETIYYKGRGRSYINPVADTIRFLRILWRSRKW